MDIKKFEAEASAVLVVVKTLAPAIAVLANFLPEPHKTEVTNVANVINTMSDTSPSLPADLEKVIADVSAIISAIAIVAPLVATADTGAAPVVA